MSGYASLPTAKEDLEVGLWQMQQRAQANLPDRAVLRHIHELRAKLADSETHAAAWQAQVTEYQGRLARLEAMNAEINAKWRDDRALLLDGEKPVWQDSGDNPYLLTGTELERAEGRAV